MDRFRGVHPAAALQAVPGWGPMLVQSLVEALGSAEGVLGTAPSRLAEVIGCEVRQVQAALDRIPWRELRRDRRQLTRLGGRLVTRFDGGMPEGWSGMVDPPVVVRVRGRAEVLRDRPGVAIVGARRCSPLGADLAARFATAFVRAGWSVVSGGARGIDAAAHRAALRIGGPTIVVLGSGLGVPYPPEHDSLFDRIVEGGGAVLSEHPCDRPPRPSQFPVRNRLVAAFGPGTVVIEAGARSGALITARLAAEDYGREVAAVPGRPDVDAHAGCHRAIREGWATLVDEPSQAVELLSTQWGLLRAGRSGSGIDPESVHSQGRAGR